MTSYIPGNTPRKKFTMLKRREEELLHEIRFGKWPERLGEAAEKVRTAQIGYLKGRKYFAAYPGETDLSRVQKIDLEIKDWQKMTADEIVEKYKKLSDKEGPPGSLFNWS
jgi:hypothetical protein